MNTNRYLKPNTNRHKRQPTLELFPMFADTLLYISAALIGVTVTVNTVVSTESLVETKCQNSSKTM